MKYLCLAYEEERKINELPQDQWHALRQETLDYVALLRAKGQLVDTRPLQSARTASTLRVRDGKVDITDGPFAETREQIGGFFLIEVVSREEALAVASRWPSARLGSIEVRPLEDGLSMERRYS